jgi:hypothetical protein
MSTNEKKPGRTFDREVIESAVKLVTSGPISSYNSCGFLQSRPDPFDFSRQA